MKQQDDEMKHEQVVRYAAGCMSPEEASAFEERARHDEELAADIVVARFMIAAFLDPSGGASATVPDDAGGERSPASDAGTIEDSQPAHTTNTQPSVRTLSVRSAPHKTLIAASLALLAIGGFLALCVVLYATQAAYAQTKQALDRTGADYTKAKEALDRTKEELEETRKSKRRDNFDSDWLDPTKWKTGRRKTTAQDGYARLNDRGSLVTVEEFKGPVEINLDWRWIDIAGDISYRDTLTIVLHTSGEHAKTHPFRIRDGIEVTFQTHSGQVSLASPTDGDFRHATPEAALPIPAGKWHRIRIVDSGKEILIYFSGPAIDAKYKDKPVLTAAYKGDFPKHHIAIYNREVVAGALHESHIDNVVVRGLK